MIDFKLLKETTKQAIDRNEKVQREQILKDQANKVTYILTKVEKISRAEAEIGKSSCFVMEIHSCDFKNENLIGVASMVYKELHHPEEFVFVKIIETDAGETEMHLFW